MMVMKKISFCNIQPMWILMAVTFLAITVTGIVFKQSWFRMIPLYVSLIIGMLQSKANRYSSLMGGINSLLYAVVYWSLSLYGSAAYALLVSCPIQLVTFIRWSKHAYKHSTEFRKMTSKQRMWVLLGMLAAFVVLYIILARAGSGYQILDNASTLMGILVSFLTMFAFIEYTWLMLPSGVVGICLDLSVSVNHPEQITYVIYACYSLICVTIGFFRVRQLYAEQQKSMGTEVPSHETA